MINRIVIDNFKSIRHLDLELKPLNVLIGANGSGKSNLIGFLEMVRRIMNGNAQKFFIENGGANNLFHFGLKYSSQINCEVALGDSEIVYSFEIQPDKNYSLFFSKEQIQFLAESNLDIENSWGDKNDKGSIESDIITKLFERFKEDYFVFSRYWSKKRIEVVRKYYSNSQSVSIGVFHFNDTSFTSSLRRIASIYDNDSLRDDGRNLAAFLYYLQVKHPKEFNRIEGTVKSVAPFFKRFNLKPNKLDPESILLEWVHEFKDEYFNAQHLSDGTIRLIALATLLLQPDPPKLIVIDEPELGLHPFAIAKLAALIKKASLKTQVIIATQSNTLVAEFEPEDIVTVDWKDGQSTFQRHTTEELAVWLEDYTLGEIWDKNIIGGQP